MVLWISPKVDSLKKTDIIGKILQICIREL